MKPTREWFVLFPRDGSAIGPIKAENEKGARDWARWFDGCSKLPDGFQVWEYHRPLEGEDYGKGDCD